MSKRKRLVESLKTVLIILLSCSAVYLTLRSQLFGDLNALLSRQQTELDDSAVSASQVDAAQPLRMAVMTDSGCYGVQYGSPDLTTLFYRVAPLLNEALSSAGDPVSVTRARWETALLSSPSIYFDFQGAIPLSVLSGWLSGQENAALTASVRHLILTAGSEDNVVMYYRDESSGGFFSCPVEVVNLSHLQSAVSEVSANGAFFACQSLEYQALDPYTLISAQTPQPQIYTASNPLATGDTEWLDPLLEALSISPGATVLYTSSDGLVAHNVGDTLRISNSGQVSYSSADGGQRYQVARSEGNSLLFDSLEYTRQLASGVLNLWPSPARLYLAQVETLGEDLWRFEFWYALDNTPVQVYQEGYAASFQVTEGFVEEFELQLRSYTASGQTEQVLPEELACAALVQLGEAGGQLQLCYQDSGDDTVRAGWVTW